MLYVLFLFVRGPCCLSFKFSVLCVLFLFVGGREGGCPCCLSFYFSVLCFVFVCGGFVFLTILVFCVVCFDFVCGVRVAFHFSFLCCVFSF